MVGFDGGEWRFVEVFVFVWVFNVLYVLDFIVDVVGRIMGCVEVFFEESEFFVCRI